MSIEASNILVTGGAGFIGAHLVNHLLDSGAGRVTVFDNFSTGRRWAFGERLRDPRLEIVEGDAAELEPLVEAVAGHDAVCHLASNSDIAAAADDPSIDFRNGTVLTSNVLEAMRKTGVRRIVFTSGSGVYGDVPDEPLPEEYPRMIPISTYGACKLASETLISAYAHMFDMSGTAFRFGNVVGPQQTHGVSYDFIRRLARDPSRLTIYGDGQQTKPYIHIEDVIAAFRLALTFTDPGFRVLNVASQDSLTVREIADIVTAKMELTDTQYAFTGGARGWKADVPVYRLDSSRIRALGWSNQRTSREAVEASVEAMLEDLREGRITAAEPE